MLTRRLASYRETLTSIWKPGIPDGEAEALIAGHLPMLERLDQVEGSSVALLDLRTFGYRFLTRSFRIISALSRDSLGEDPQRFFFSLIHPDDLEPVLETTLRTFRFLDSVPARTRGEYRLCFDFRIEAGPGHYVRMLQQTVVLEQDSGGVPWLILIVNDRSPLQDLSAPPRRRLVHTPTGRLHLFPPEEGETSPPLTVRELEVLGMIAQGYVSREIADLLSISVHTVNNHRAAILEKMEAENCFEAVTRAARLGLV